MPRITAFRPELVVRLMGPAVGPGRLAARDLAGLARSLDQALIRVGQVLSGTMKRRRRPSAREVEEICRLYLVSWTPGSAVAGFDFSEPNRKVMEFGHLAEDSLSTFLRGLIEITAAETPDTPVPQGYDRRVLETCARLGGLLEHGVAEMTFAAPASPHIPTVKYDTWVGERIRILLDRVRSHWKPGELAFFGDAAQLSRSIPFATPPAAAALPEVLSSFWKSKPLEQMAADQGVTPITKLSELDSMWSEHDDVFDDALSELLEERGKRRREVYEP